MAQRVQLLLLFALPLATKCREACNSGLKGDFAYKTCAKFCNSTRLGTHCRFCKCMQCDFCGGTVALTETKKLKFKAADSTSPPVGEASLMTASVSRADATGMPATTTTITPETGIRPAFALGLAPVISFGLLMLGVIAYSGYSYQQRLSGSEGRYMMESLANSELSEGGDGTPGRSKASTPHDEQGLSPVAVRTLVVSFLCLQYSVYALLRRYATGILLEGWSFASVLGAGECIKLVVSIAVIVFKSDGSQSPQGPLPERIKYLLRTSGKMSIPAFLYLAMNMLGFVGLGRVDAGTFAVVQQTKLFFTAFFSRIFLERVLSIPKWCALTTLALGVLVVSLESQPGQGCAVAAAPTAMNFGAPYVVGLIAVSLDSALSGVATVYFEKVLKTTSLTVWDRNLQLSFWSMLIYVPWAIYDNPTEPFAGWSVVTVLVALLGAGGGILVALVIKYADGLAKNIATASSIVLTTAASHVLFGGPMSSTIIAGSFIVIASGYNYQTVS